MKKIGLWMAALTAVTVGGVYATFNYTNSNDMTGDVANKAIQIAGSKQEGAAGTLAIDASNFRVVIDSASTIMGADLNVNAHTAMISATGSVVVTFTPNTNLQETDILENGVHAKVYFNDLFGYDTLSYEDENGTDVQIFTAFNNNLVEIHQTDETADGIAKWTKETDGSFTYTITAEDLFKNAATDLLVMNDIILETIEEYNRFAAVFSSTVRNIQAVVEPNTTND